MQLFPYFSAKDGNKYVPIRDYFGFIHALHLLLAVFRNSFRLRIISDPLDLQADYTDDPYKNCQSFPSAEILSVVFLRTHPQHHQQTEQQQKRQSEQVVDQVLYSAMDGRQCQNKDHGDTVKKNAQHVFMFFSDQFKKAPQARFSTAGHVWTT